MYEKATYITDTMQLTEVSKALRLGYQDIAPRLPGLSADFRKAVERKKPSGVTWSSVRSVDTSVGGVEYRLIYNTPSFYDYKKGGLFFVVYGLFYYRGNLYGFYLTDPNKGTFVYFTSHLLQRYIERERKTEAVAATEAVDMFIRGSGCRIMINRVDLPKHAGCLYGTTQEGGVVLGSEVEGETLLRTYISADLLRGSQIDTTEGQKAVIAAYLDRAINTRPGE